MILLSCSSLSYGMQYVKAAALATAPVALPAAYYGAKDRWLTHVHKDCGYYCNKKDVLRAYIAGVGEGFLKTPLVVLDTESIACAIDTHVKALERWRKKEPADKHDGSPQEHAKVIGKIIGNQAGLTLWVGLCIHFIFKYGHLVSKKF